jgi:hypothetical protein
MVTDEHRESRKEGSTILNLNPSSSWWNGTLWHQWVGKRNSRMHHQHKKSWLQSGDEKGVILKNLLPREMTVYCDYCIETVWSLNAYLLLAHPTVKLEALLLHDTTVCTTEAITKFRWTVLLHVPENSDLGLHISTCLVLWQTACGATIVQMRRHCRIPWASGRR